MPRTSFQFVIASFKIVLYLAFFVFASTSVDAQTSTEYQIKAVYLFRFAQFVQWPADAFANSQSPIILGVVGASPFGNALAEAVKGESVNGRKLEVRQYQNLQDIKSCHVLFISRSESTRLSTILSEIKGHSVLTVSDAENFLAQGGMIEFVTDQNRVRFKINRASAEAANLVISSKLLRLGM